MMEDDIRLEALKLAVARNQKLSAQAGDVVNEAKIYAEFIEKGFTKSTSAAKK
jgi:hypothetical protein